jgi:hypothetical protein
LPELRHRLESRGLKFCAGCANGGVIEKRGRATAAVKPQACPVCGGDVPAFNEKGSKNRSGYCSRPCANRAYYRRAQMASARQSGIFSGVKLPSATLIVPDASYA